MVVRAETTTNWRRSYPWEDWILARSLVGSIPEHDEERDLFAGIRQLVNR